MDQKSEITALLRQEEGIRYTPYLDSLGYPTIGVGFRLGPQGAPLNNYTFSLNDQTINAWLDHNLAGIEASMWQNSEIALALSHCNQPRRDILTSMAYQMGASGLGKFHRMLAMIMKEDWREAAAEMLDSTWARQTSARAHRHAEVMNAGVWAPTYPF
ncbi:glycoside hydrolase family protein [Enterobacter asburiae]|uniref:glycoside hydrolase family protein n=1 Tax=Enterobacter asburiae TaxID=61645 RepID=UPI002004DC8D|nr:glycoside hydrolase family protein [Enterobacter asburiae]MCK7229459.1 glycoside hydrolase family protein [Enterobacter asburiae]